MNSRIREQLEKCKVANIPNFNDDSTELIIPVGMKKDEDEIKLNGFYLIEVEDYIIHPYSGFTLHDNWNNGIIPTDKQMNICVNQIMGKMIKVDAAGVNDRKHWSGWLPKKSFKILKNI